MKAEEYFNERWENSHLLRWIGVDEGALRDIVCNAFRAGAKSVCLDREMLEGLLQDMDQEDELREQEGLRRGLG